MGKVTHLGIYIALITIFESNFTSTTVSERI
uniref:Uncharacterized protein n=1 Tax=Anguilla anguilla TaxID=7936 RepID=A0A0E9RB25_ANGAN